MCSFLVKLRPPMKQLKQLKIEYLGTYIMTTQGLHSWEQTRVCNMRMVRMLAFSSLVSGPNSLSGKDQRKLPVNQIYSQHRLLNNAGWIIDPNSTQNASSKPTTASFQIPNTEWRAAYLHPQHDTIGFNPQPTHPKNLICQIRENTRFLERSRKTNQTHHLEKFHTLSNLANQIPQKSLLKIETDGITLWTGTHNPPFHVWNPEANSNQLGKCTPSRTWIHHHLDPCSKIQTCPQVLHSRVLRKNKDPLIYWPLPILFVCLFHYLHGWVGDTAYFYSKLWYFHHLLNQRPEFWKLVAHSIDSKFYRVTVPFISNFVICTKGFNSHQYYIIRCQIYTPMFPIMVLLLSVWFFLIILQCLFISPLQSAFNFFT